MGIYPTSVHTVHHFFFSFTRSVSRVGFTFFHKRIMFKPSIRPDHPCIKQKSIHFWQIQEKKRKENGVSRNVLNLFWYGTLLFMDNVLSPKYNGSPLFWNRVSLVAWHWTIINGYHPTDVLFYGDIRGFSTLWF